MVRCTAYSTRVKTLHSARPHALDSRYDEIVAACKAQNITHIGILASVTGKLLAEPEQFRVYRDKLAADGITCWAEVFAVGHPAMGSYYHEDGTPPDPAYTGRAISSSKRTTISTCYRRIGPMR